MRVLAIDPVPSSSRGGQEKSLFDIIKGLRKNDIDVDLLYKSNGDYIPDYKNLGVICMKYPSLHIRHSVLSLLQFVYTIISFLLKRRKYDVIYINEILELPIAFIISRFTHSKVICHLRLPPNIENGNFYISKKNQIGLLIDYVDYFIVANQVMFDLYSDVGLPVSKLKIIPNGFWVDELPSVKAEKSNEIRKLVYLGRITNQKGVHELIEIFHELVKNNDKLSLDIIGKPLNSEQDKYLYDLINKVEVYNLNTKVNFIPGTNNPIKTLNNYDLCIFPSVCSEAFGRVLFESIYANTPIIGNNVGSVSSIIDDTNMEWTYTSNGDAVSKISNFIDDPSSYNLLERRKSMLKKYDLNHIIEQIIILFKDE
ncbi:glycosyltransferase family 4 protein [Flammeovirga sp. SJP92]|uniref:glycosyltransferase family 4 protein n=1 Tax=Flammeovirga sp. SJP92 TaxID=1775430 RepID=UPI00078905E4|nr:glycosyltransferase family 4 protein [Flammeovirga sp. SJP92]KXX70410.1 hypothetical protein AVL50_09015 [Flammeovirga sp. SJP92]